MDAWLRRRRRSAQVGAAPQSTDVRAIAAVFARLGTQHGPQDERVYKHKMLKRVADLVAVRHFLTRLAAALRCADPRADTPSAAVH